MMKLRFTLPMLAVALLVGCSKNDDIPNPETNAKNEVVTRTNFAVISDIHYFSPALYDSKENPAFQEYLNGDRKMLKESGAILDEALSEISASKTPFLLIPGDLTKDGEKKSHEEVAAKLEALSNKGVKVFVIPGNHDINNPHAKSFLNGESAKVEHINKEDFARIYNNFGYGDAIKKDAASLSYLVEPVKGLWLIGIDACKYENNVEEPVTGGAIRPATLQWIKDILAEAKKQNKTVFAMMHHGLVEHFTGQHILFQEYLVDNYEQVADDLAKSGLNFIFTGHMHANDIVKKNVGSSAIYDIETGSTVSYPCPIRFVDLDMVKNNLNITTKKIDHVSVPSIPAGKTFQEFASATLDEGARKIAISMLSKPEILSRILPADMAQDAKDRLLSNPMLIGFAFSAIHVDQAAADILIAHYAGDEKIKPEQQALVDELAKLSPMVGGILNGAWNDLAPADNNVVINYKSNQ